MSARLTSALQARVTQDSLKRKQAEVEKAEKKASKKKGGGAAAQKHKWKPEKRQKELKKRKRQRTAEAEANGNFLDLAKKELRRSDKTQRNVKLLTQRRDLSGKAEDLMLSILGVEKPAGGADGDSDDDGLFDF